MQQIAIDPAQLLDLFEDAYEVRLIMLGSCGEIQPLRLVRMLPARSQSTSEHDWARRSSCTCRNRLAISWACGIATFNWPQSGKEPVDEIANGKIIALVTDDPNRFR